MTTCPAQAECNLYANFGGGGCSTCFPGGYHPVIKTPVTFTPELRQLVVGAIEEFTCGEMECQCGRITETFKDYTETELDEWLKERISA